MFHNKVMLISRNFSLTSKCKGTIYKCILTELVRGDSGHLRNDRCIKYTIDDISKFTVVTNSLKYIVNKVMIENITYFSEKII